MGCEERCVSLLGGPGSERRQEDTQVGLEYKGDWFRFDPVGQGSSLVNCTVMLWSRVHGQCQGGTGRIPDWSFPVLSGGGSHFF